MSLKMRQKMLPSFGVTLFEQISRIAVELLTTHRASRRALRIIRFSDASVSRLARQHHVKSPSGDGGDELLGLSARYPLARQSTEITGKPRRLVKMLSTTRTQGCAWPGSVGEIYRSSISPAWSASRLNRIFPDLP
jgi:hypothetical protein